MRKSITSKSACGLMILLVVALSFNVPAVMSVDISKCRSIAFDGLRIAEIPSGGVVADRWYAHLGLRNTYEAQGISGEVWIYENDIASSSKKDFIAFALTLTRPVAPPDFCEWYEVGYYQDYSGYWWYSATWIKESYHEIRHWHAIPSSGAHPLKIIEAANGRFEAYIDNTLVDYTYFSSYVSSERIYGAQAESSDPTNPMRGHFSSLTYLDLDWHSWSIIEAHQDLPYYARLACTDAFDSTLLGDIDLNYAVDLGDVAEINLHFYDRFWDPTVNQWVYIIGIEGYAPHADINHDGFVNLYDIGSLNYNWGKSW